MATQAADYNVVQTTILGALNVSEETYWRCLREVDLTRDSSIRLVGNLIRSNGLCWLKLATQTAQEIIELILLEQFLMVLPQNAKYWVLCQKPQTLEAAVTAMGTYEAATQPIFTAHSSGSNARR